MKPNQWPIAAEGSTTSDTLELETGSRVAVIGGGPAGSLFTYFLLEFADRIGLELATRDVFVNVTGGLSVQEPAADLAVALAIFFVGFSWIALGVAFAFWFVRMFAITGFYHRYFSHHAFKTSRAMQPFRATRRPSVHRRSRPTSRPCTCAMSAPPTARRPRRSRTRRSTPSSMRARARS